MMGYHKISYFRQLWYVIKYALHRRNRGGDNRA